jgi:phenylacetate-coenzyme A ligase PaaK-like adenylate-forming protein
MTTTVANDLDLLRERFRRELSDRLPGHLERIGWSAGRLGAHQRDRLRAVLAAAIEGSPFHRRRLRGIDVERIELADLAALPVMTKSDLMGEFDAVTTDRRLTRSAVEDHLAASARVPGLLFGEYVCLASGGSSGQRGVFVQRVEEYAEFASSVLRHAMARTMAAAGGPPPGGTTIGMVAAASPIHSTGFAAAVASGPVRFVSVPVTLPLHEIVDRLDTLAPPAIMGYPTKLAQVAREQLAGRLHIAPRSVTTLSEPLTAEDRATISSAFGVPVIDQFGATEGLAGTSEPGDPVISFCTDTCLVELVDEDDQPVATGQPAAKALVTNLHNLTQPLVRYELADRFVGQPARSEDVYLRATVEGRADEVFRYGPVEVHPLVVRTVLVKAPAVVEYQVRQTETGVDVDVVVDRDVDPSVDTTAIAAAVEDGLRQAGLPRPRASVHHVAAVARHPDTGKVRRFIALDR